jgi:hypothetical protein
MHLQTRVTEAMKAIGKEGGAFVATMTLFAILYEIGTSIRQLIFVSSNTSLPPTPGNPY